MPDLPSAHRRRLLQGAAAAAALAPFGALAAAGDMEAVRKAGRQAANNADANLGAGRGQLTFTLQDGQLHALLAWLPGLEAARRAPYQSRLTSGAPTRTPRS